MIKALVLRGGLQCIWAKTSDSGWTMEDYVYCIQLLQAEAVGFAVNSWRRQFGGPGEEICSGALVWQLNDK